MARQSTQHLTTRDPAIPVLLTRPKAQSQAFAAALAARFGLTLPPVISPLIAPVFLTPALPRGQFTGVIFTSATGVAAAKGFDLPRHAYCVGVQTADLARAAGFQALSADGNAAALIAAILANPPVGRLMHLRGEEAKGDIAQSLSSAGIETVSVVVYRQDPLSLTEEALSLLAAEGPVIVPLFSPRTAALLQAALPDELGANLWLVAMSEAVAKAGPSGAERLEIARRPDAEAMLDAVDRLLEMRPTA